MIANFVLKPHFLNSLCSSLRNNPDTDIDGITFLESVTLDEALDLTRRCTFITEAYYPYEIIHANAGKFLTHLFHIPVDKKGHFSDHNVLPRFPFLFQQLSQD